ncbi:MAG: hypothetical protein Q9169_008646, partial [Polycauliona sp. 2 TL-2023]
MLPLFLQSAYRTYKEDTTVIATWLAVTAKRCGYPADLITHGSAATQSPAASQPPGRLNGRVPKLAESSTGTHSLESKDGTTTASQQVYNIKARDFISLANFITGKSRSKVPEVLIQSLTRAIALRRRYGRYSQEQGGETESDETQTHFMGVLEHTLEILKPYAPKPLEWPLTDTETEDSVDR